MYKTDEIVKQHLRESFLYKMPPREERFLDNIKLGTLFGYNKCDIEVLETLREAFANFPLNFKNINIGRVDIGPFMREFVEKEGLLT